MTLDSVARAVAPWQSLYDRSTAVSTAVMVLHLGALLIAGGLAIAADRATLRALRRPIDERRSPLAELHAVHSPVLLALTVVFASGLLLAAADVPTFAVSLTFWFKMALVVLLLMNGARLRRTERQIGVAYALGTEAPARLWRSLRRGARLSLALWLLTTAAGTVLTNAA
jgi:hypothetical protein